MRKYIIPIVLLFFISIVLTMGLFSCQQKNNQDTHADQGQHQHSDATHANEHMHQVGFDTLVKHFEDPSRDEWQQPDWVIAQLGDLSDKVVADIGAGTGYFAFRIAQKAKKVIAIDIDERFLNYIKQKNDSLQLPVETRLVTTDDPKLKPGETDIVIIVDTYHHIENRPVYFANVRKKLKPGGSLVVVDFKKEEMPVGPPINMKLEPQTVVKELRQAGFETFHVNDEHLKYQYLIIAQ